MCRFRVNGRPVRHIFHRFQNVPVSCERFLNQMAWKEPQHFAVDVPWKSFDILLRLKMAAFFIFEAVMPSNF